MGTSNFNPHELKNEARFGYVVVRICLSRYHADLSGHCWSRFWHKEYQDGQLKDLSLGFQFEHNQSTIGEDHTR